MAEVFLLGAGFSKAISEHMPLLAELSRKVQARTSSKAHSPIWDMFEDDLEMWLTYLSQSHPWLSESGNLRNRALFLDLSRSIADELEECENLAIQSFPPDWLSNLSCWWHERKTVIITLNYDTLIERAAATTRYHLHCNDLYPITLTPAAHREAGVVGSERVLSLQLFKLHGSVNWFYSGSTTFYGETLYLVSIPLHPVDTNHYRETVKDKVPLIVPPLTEKSLFFFQHETIRTLWAQAAAALREATCVFCLGYSFPPTDISLRFFLQANAPQGKVPFFIVNLPQREIVSHFRELLPGYDVQEQFISINPIPRFVETLVV
jgi:hypothetical protein